MKSLVKAMLFLVLVGCVGVTGFALFFLNQFNMLQGKAEAYPQPVTLSALKTGVPRANHHVTLSDYTFGEPIIEKDGDTWQGVWLPLSVSKSQPPIAVLWLSNVRNRSQLNEYLSKTTLNAMVSNGLPESSLFRIDQSGTLREELTKPPENESEDESTADKDDPAKTKRPLLESTDDLVLLSEPVVTLPNGATIAFRHFMSDGSTVYAYGAIAGAVFLAVLCFFVNSLLKRPKKKFRVTESDPKEYQKMKEEPPLSVHPLSWALLRQELIKRFGMVLIGSLLTALVLVYAVIYGNDGLHAVAMVLCGVGILIGVVTLFLLYFLARAWFQGVAEVEVYSQGLSWIRKKEKEFALWEDIAEVYRDQQRFYREGQRVDTLSWLKLVLYDGRELFLTEDMLADFAILAEHILSRHGDWVYNQKGEELENGGVAEFSKDLIIYHDGLQLRGKPYRWHHLQNFEVRGGSLIFRLSKYTLFSTVKFSLEELPNYLALLKLIEDLPTFLDRSPGGYAKNPLLQSYG